MRSGGEVGSVDQASQCEAVEAALALKAFGIGGDDGAVCAARMRGPSTLGGGGAASGARMRRPSFNGLAFLAAGIGLELCCNAGILA